MEEVKNFGSELMEIYNGFISSLPSSWASFANVLMMVLLIVVYSILVWKFYKFISRKNPLGLDLNQYNSVGNNFFSKLAKGGLYFIEYILILPILIFVVFGIFTFLLIILAQTENTSQIIVISASIIAAIRITSYYKEGLSQELAKMLPLTLLAITLLNPNTFADMQYLERIFNHLSQLPSFFTQIIKYLLFIVFIEAILRFLDLIFLVFGVEEADETQEKTN